jgi:formylglycine-generating enzyme required for sulfatase activity
VRSEESRDAFRWGLENFIKEARVLGKFSHPSLIPIHRFFEANNTAYFVMEFAEGVTLASLLKHEGKLEEQRLLGILRPILDGLEEVHARDVLHRDIKPDNIILRQGTAPVLIDFGAARQNLTSMTRSIMSVLTAGYAPIEQYATGGNQGPWTDLYAIGAVAYRAISGNKPTDAINRIRHDPLEPASRIGEGKYSKHFLAAIDWALAVEPEDRPGSVAHFREALEGRAPSRPHPPREHPGGKISALGGTLPPEVASESATVVVEKRALESARSGTGVPSWVGIAFGVAAVAAVTAYLALRDHEVPKPPEQATLPLATPPIATPEDEPAPPTATPAAPAPSPQAGAAPSQPPQQPPAGSAPATTPAKQDAPATAAASPATSVPATTPATAPAQQAEPAQPTEQARVAESRPVEPAPVAAPVPKVAVAQMAPHSTFEDCPQCPTMVVLPTGTFQMGALPADNGNAWEGPAHAVTIGRPFAIARHEVTVAQWRACVDAKACPAAAPGPSSGDATKAPAVNLNFADAHAYAGWLTRTTGRRYRLPSEAEWEYAIRAKTTTARYWGGDRTKQCGYGNGADQAALAFDAKLQVVECNDGQATLAPVGTFQANAWGLFDMAGNAWEWTQDCWRDGYAGAPADGSAMESGACDRRAIRGGSWRARPNSLRSFGRGHSAPGIRGDDLGLRVVAE